LFDIFRIVYKVDKKPVNQFKCAKEFFGTLRSIGFKIIFLDMTNFHFFYSARYFILARSNDSSTHYSKPVNLNFLSSSNITSRVSPNFSSFKSFVNYSFSLSDDSILSLPYPFTRIVFPFSYTYAGTSYDFSWFFLQRNFSNFSAGKTIAPCSKLVITSNFFLKFVFFFIYYLKEFKLFSRRS